MIQTGLLILTAICDAFLAALAISSNRKSVQKRYFAYFLVFCMFWAIGAGLMLYAPYLEWAYAGMFLYMLSPLFVTFFILIFSYNYPDETKLKRIPVAIAFLLLVIYSVAITARSDLFIGTLEVKPGGNLVVPVQPGYTIYSFYFTIFFVWYCTVLWLKYKKTTLVNKRYLIRYFLYAIGISTIFAVTSNLMIPNTTGSMQYVWIGPMSSLLLSILVAIVIIRHQFLDIRPVVARSVAYILSLGVLVGIYSITVLALPRNLEEELSPATQQMLTALTLIVLALSYQPLKKVFDKVTNKIFYRDAYDAQELLDRLNKMLVTTLDLNTLLVSTSGIIGDTLKASFCAFGIRETKSQERRIIGNMKGNFSEDDIAAVRHFTIKGETKIIITDNLSDAHAGVRSILRKYNVSIIVRLVNATGSVEEGYGYLILGDKRSGNPYSSGDLKVIEIIADELVLAIQNAMRFEEIQNFNIKLAKEVEDATSELRKTNEKLVALDQAKDEFISMASHQLRTPLTSVKGYLSMVLEGDAGKLNPKERKLLNQAFASSQRMVYLISDLLNLSRLKTGKFVIESNPVNLAEVIGGEVEQLIETAASHNLKLTYNKPKDFPTLMFDETKIRQVIMNFIDNAIHYTPSGGKIEVRLEDNPHAVEFSVTDTGIGVAKHEQPHLFTKFFRAGNAKKARPDGTGLGLYMAKKIIIAQGGSIIFKSHENKGSTFGFTFSKAKLQTHSDASTNPTTLVHGHLKLPPQ